LQRFIPQELHNQRLASKIPGISDLQTKITDVAKFKIRPWVINELLAHGRRLSKIATALELRVLRELDTHPVLIVEEVGNKSQ
jgi:hypothetical protein